MVVPNVPDLEDGALVEGRIRIGRRVFGIVRENRLVQNATYRIDGYQVENNDWHPRSFPIDALQSITRVRLIVRLTSPVHCDQHQMTTEPGRSYLLTDADGETPAREAMLQLPLAIHIPCSDDSHHSIEVRTGEQVTLDMAKSPWPNTPHDQVANVARVLPFNIDG